MVWRQGIRTLSITEPSWSEDRPQGERMKSARDTANRKQSRGDGTGPGRAGRGHPGWPHSLPLHLLLLLEDFVGFHRQPLLHQELLPLQLSLPNLCQPLPVCHKQLPALVGRKQALCSVPGETRSTEPELWGAKMWVVFSSLWPSMSGMWLLFSVTLISGWAGVFPPAIRASGTEIPGPGECGGDQGSEELGCR